MRHCLRMALGSLTLTRVQAFNGIGAHQGFQYTGLNMLPARSLEVSHDQSTENRRGSAAPNAKVSMTLAQQRGIAFVRFDPGRDFGCRSMSRAFGQKMIGNHALFGIGSLPAWRESLAVVQVLLRALIMVIKDIGEFCRSTHKVQE